MSLVLLVCPVCKKEFVGNYEGRKCCSRECASELLGTPLDRMFARSKRTDRGCLEWQGERFKKKYGRIKVDGVRYLVHRLSWLLQRGEIPPGKQVLHHCDNPPCWQIRHLFLGTQLENIQDMFSKGRQNKARGEGHGRAKKTEAEMLSMINEYRAGGITQKELAMKYALHPIYVNKVLTGKKWAHLQG
jgi:hypothetical protein